MTDDAAAAGSRPTPPDFWVHRAGDHVAVAITDIVPGQAHGCVLADDRDLTAEVQAPIPLGHKFALVALNAGDQVLEYGVPVAVTTQPISAGEHVHTHNVRSARWQRSVAT